MQENNSLKKTIMGGFDKQSVIEHVDSLNLKYASLERELNQQIEKLSIENNKLKDQMAEKNERITMLESALQESDLKNKALCKKADDLNMGILGDKKQEHELKKQLDLLNEQNKMLAKELKSAIQKAEKFDNAAIEVGAILIDAKASAETIISDAKSQGDSIMDEAKAQSQSMIENAQEKAAEILENAGVKAQEMQKSTEENLNVLNGELDSFKIDIASLESGINAAFSSMKGHIASLACSVDKIREKSDIIAAMSNCNDNEENQEENLSYEETSQEESENC